MKTQDAEKQFKEVYLPLAKSRLVRITEESSGFSDIFACSITELMANLMQLSDEVNKIKIELDKIKKGGKK